jgi:head-tail adaptor
MARRAAGAYREVFAVEASTRSRNEAGAVVETWSEAFRIYGSYEAVSYFEEDRRRRISSIVRTRYRDDIKGSMRLRWISRNDRILYIAGIVEQGNREDLELTVEEKET